MARRWRRVLAGDVWRGALQGRARPSLLEPELPELDWRETYRWAAAGARQQVFGMCSSSPGLGLAARRGGPAAGPGRAVVAVLPFN